MPLNLVKLLRRVVSSQKLLIYIAAAIIALIDIVLVTKQPVIQLKESKYAFALKILLYNSTF